MCGWKTLPDGRKIYISCAKRNAVIGLVLALGVAGGGGGISASAGAAADAAAAAARSAASPRSAPKSAHRAERRIPPSDIARKLQRMARSAKASGDAGTDCAAHAYGQVQEWLRRHPCVGFARTLVELELSGGATVLVAVAAVEMPDAGEARELRALIDRNGTGNLRELSKDRGRFTRVDYAGAAYRSKIDETVVVNAQAQVAAAGRSLPDLAGLAQSSLD
jgi:hypothetical protein